MVQGPCQEQVVETAKGHVASVEEEEVRGMAGTEQRNKAAATMERLDAEWERRRARLLRSLTETPLDRWLRRRR